MTSPKLAIHAGSLPAAPTIVPVCQIGPHSHRQSGRAPSDPSVCANTYHRPPSQSDRVDRSRPTSFRPTPRPIPHSAGCTLRALPTAISCLGAFRTPAAGARGWHRGCRHPKTCTCADVDMAKMLRGWRLHSGIGSRSPEGQCNLSRGAHHRKIVTDHFVETNPTGELPG